MIAAIGSINSSSSTLAVSAADSSRKARLEKQLTTYTQQLAEAQKDAATKAGALRIQLIQQQILAIQQQLAQLEASSATALPNVEKSSVVAANTAGTSAGNLIDISV